MGSRADPSLLRRNTSSRVSQTLRLAAVAAVWLLNRGANAGEPYSVAGLRLGLGYEAVLQDARYDCESLAGCFLYSACRDRASLQPELGGVPLQAMTLYFQGERMSGLSAEFPSSRFDEAAEALRERYGGPSPERAEQGDTVLLWEQGSQLMRLQRNARPLRSSLILSERSFLSEIVTKKP
jgi:hypothetical protein